MTQSHDPNQTLQIISSPKTKPGSRIDYVAELNHSQLEAVTFGKGPLLVIAGAGSGKTRTLTYRVAHIVESGVSPSRILLLSFTRKASQEMLRRASQLLDQRCQEVAGGTFHSFANSVLRRYASSIGFENGFSIIDRADSEDLIGLIRKELASQNDIGQLPRQSTLATIFSKVVNKNESLEDIIYEDFPHFAHQQELIYKIWGLYAIRKKEHYFVDYDDLLVYLYKLLDENNVIKERLAAKYEYILVDEYQDTNLIQARIVFLLAGQDRNVMVVGDDAQSIYAFRGANYKNIINFPDHFPGTHIIKLEENYRSLQPILDLTNTLIASAAEKYSKCLFTRKGGGARPQLVCTLSENAQSAYIVKQVAHLRREGILLDRIAVLFRAGFHSFDLELELNRAAIPFVKVGGFKFVESAHIKDILAHLKIFTAPRDRLSWYRILLLIEKIGPSNAQQIYESLIEEGSGPTGLLTAAIKQKNSPGIERLKELIVAIDAAPNAISRWGELALEYYMPILKAKYDDYPRRQRDIEQLITIMERYQDLDGFLTDMALEPPNTSSDNHLTASTHHDDSLTLTTIHSAKGLEWDTVFIIWALDGRFPSHHAIDDADAMEEERRLMYVAATRAERQLHIVYPTQIYDRTTQSYLYEPSRFLDGIFEDTLGRVFYNATDDY